MRKRDLGPSDRGRMLLSLCSERAIPEAAVLGMAASLAATMGAFYTDLGH